MSDVARVAVVLVTHDAQDFLEATLASIDAQSRQADVLIAVDDFSTDATVRTLRDHGFTTHLATSSASDTTTRIAQNFQQGLHLAEKADADIVILGDHDDLWHHDRIQHQIQILEGNPHTAMLASDGYLIGELGAAIPGTIRSHFPVPTDFNERSMREQLAYALRHSIATGGACALRPSALREWTVPIGWLHDRWWSLTAVRHGRFLLDSTAVIDYRISSDQQVGLDTADQHEPTRWLIRKARNFRRSAGRARDFTRLAGG